VGGSSILTCQKEQAQQFYMQLEAQVTANGPLYGTLQPSYGRLQPEEYHKVQPPSSETPTDSEIATLLEGLVGAYGDLSALEAGYMSNLDDSEELQRTVSSLTLIFMRQL
jgi:hypothetical protein